jgi:hypothetical protein
MKAKTIIAVAVTAAALPFAALAQNNSSASGPQGTGWYGANNAAQPVTQPPQDSSAGATVRSNSDAYPPAHSQQTPRSMSRGTDRYNGFSADTNPPAPAP